MNKYSNSASSMDTTRTNQPNISVIEKHAAPSAYDQTNSKNHFTPSAPPFIDLNRSTGLVPNPANRTEVIQPTKKNSIPTKYYLMIVWSVVNMFLGSLLCGGIALFMSIKAFRTRRSGNDPDARIQLKNALLCNIGVTILGIIFLIVLIVVLTR